MPIAHHEISFFNRRLKEAIGKRPERRRAFANYPHHVSYLRSLDGILAPHRPFRAVVVNQWLQSIESTRKTSFGRDAILKFSP